MRTDSTSLASVAVDAARDLIASQYGREYLSDEPRVYRTKVKNAQEAHEAIRPAGHPFDFPEALRRELSPEEFKLYDLIWKRTIASQMADARGHRVTITVAAGDAVFQVSGATIEFPGYLRAYVEGSDDPQAELADRDTTLPAVQVGEVLECRQVECKPHTTQPPNRYSEASLTRALEEMGIGRPSTYAAIIETILNRKYVFKRGNVLVPTWVAFAVSQLLEKHLPDLVDYQFTAQMEDELDAISRGELEHVDYLARFYFGNDHPGLKPQLESKTGQINARDVSQIPIGKPKDDQSGSDPVYVRVGRFGPFVEQGSRRASLPEDMAPDELTLGRALALLDQAAQGDEPLGHCPQTGKPVYLKTGRFGPYVQRGDAEGDEKPQNASLLKGMRPEDMDLPTAIGLLSLPRELGEHPQTHQKVTAHNGRFGPYVKCGDESRSLPAGFSPLTVSLEEALDLLSRPKPGRGAGRRREPLRVFEASPITGQPVQLLAGRYGPYVTDGTTNASLPRGSQPELVTFEQALEWLAARAAQGPGRRFSRRKTSRRTAAKPAAKKKAKKPSARRAKSPAKPAAKKGASPARGRPPVDRPANPQRRPEG
jgi:DNA topoisomerase-1